jgi:hypothetical protein
MLVALGTTASAHAKGTLEIAQSITQLLNYDATHPDAVIRYTARIVYLHIHSDASYLSEPHAQSRASGTFFLSSKPANNSATPSPTVIPLPYNGAIHTSSSILGNVMASAAVDELTALFHNARDAISFRTTLIEMGHAQAATPTPIQTNNACATGIANETVKQRRSIAIEIRFYWIRDRVNQGQFVIQ